MNWILTPESSNILQFTYENENQILKVVFKNGSVYDFFDVPEHIFEGMKSSASKGQYLAQQVKGSYRYARV